MKQKQSLSSDTRRKRRILLGTLIPLTVIGVALGVTLPLYYSCNGETQLIKIIYTDNTTISEVEATAGSRTFEVFDNHDNPINDAAITFTPDKPMAFFSVGYIQDNKYKFQWTNQSSVGQYHITITATTPNGLTTSFDITLDITPTPLVVFTIDDTSFSTYFTGTKPIISGYTTAFTDYLDQNNVDKITIDIDGLTFTDTAVFSSCTQLQIITKRIAIEFESSTPVSVTGGTFENCASISQIIVSGTNSELSIGNNAFYGCTNLTGLARGKSQTGKIAISHLGSTAFSKCTNLNIKEINDSVISLPTGYTWNPGTDPNSGYWFKAGASSLTNLGCLAVGSIECPFPSISYDNPFGGCASLTKISKLPGGAIGGAYAFSDCLKLNTIEFSGTIFTSIGIGSFQGCASLQVIQLFASGGYTSGATIGDDAFAGCPENGGKILGANAQHLLDDIHDKNPNWLKNWTI